MLACAAEPRDDAERPHNRRRQLKRQRRKQDNGRGEILGAVGTVAAVAALGRRRGGQQNRARAQKTLRGLSADGGQQAAPGCCCMASRPPPS